jgi:hypothetical protein
MLNLLLLFGIRNNCLSVEGVCYFTNSQTDCSNYRGISLLSTSYTILFNNLPSRLSPCVDKITGDHQCGFRHNRSTTGQISFIHQTLEKKGSTTRQYISYP